MLQIDQTNILKVVLDPTLKLVLPQQERPIYRYFSSGKARDNFLNGNIYFAGVNQNRYETGEGINVDNIVKDKNEYFYSIKNTYGAESTAIIIPPFSLSFTFTYDKKKTEKFWILIEDMEGFINALKQDLLDKTDSFAHYVSWLEIEKLVRIREYKIGYVGHLPNEMPLSNEKFELGIFKIDCCELSYVNKKAIENKLTKLPGLAYNKSDNFLKEDEIRLSLNSFDFKERSGNGYRNLVKHLQLSCPSIRNFVKVYNC